MHEGLMDESMLAGISTPCRGRDKRGSGRVCGLPAHLEQHKGKVIVIDNYDSFTYNLSQVSYPIMVSRRKGRFATQLLVVEF